MELLLIRHGKAEERRPESNDFDRQLTEEGIAKTQRVAKGLLKLAPRPDVILTSPRLRALQTAQIIGEAFEIEPTPCPALASGELAQMLGAIEQAQGDCVMIVGHEPDFSALSEMLLFGKPTGTIELRKAGAAFIEIPRNGRTGVLHWLATPRMLRKMG